MQGRFFVNSNAFDAIL
jgi:hypothetical protein